MNIANVLILVIVVAVLARLFRRRQGQENSSGFRWGFLFLMVFVFLFLFMGNRGPFRDRDSWTPKLSSVQISETPSPTAEVHVVRDFLASMAHEKAEHQYGISKSAYTSSGKGFAERTIEISEDGTEIVISHKSESRAPRANKRNWAGNVGFAVAALIVVAFLYIGYLFLDAGTRGQFSWALRVVSIVAFVAICAVVALLRQRM